MTEPEMKEYVEVAEKMNKVVEAPEEDISWEDKYDTAFDMGLAVGDYYNPDGSYKDDVQAYNNAVQDKAERYRKILKVLTT